MAARQPTIASASSAPLLLNVAPLLPGPTGVRRPLAGTKPAARGPALRQKPGGAYAHAGRLGRQPRSRTLGAARSVVLAWYTALSGRPACRGGCHRTATLTGH